jgi:site-specific recombinase XerD
MPELLDIRFSFFLRASYKDSDGKNPIILRITFRGNRRDLFTGLYCFKENWDKSSNTVLKTDTAAKTKNKNLELILRKTMDAFDSFRFSREPFILDQLVDRIKGREVNPELLIDCLQEGINKTRKRVEVDLTRGSYYKYRRSLQYMQEFLFTEYNAKNYTLNKINSAFLEKFFYFLRRDKNIGNNTSMKYLSILKSILSPAIKSSAIKGDPFSELKLKAKPVVAEFLTQGEIDLLSHLKTNDADLERKKDIFLFACYTGLAYVDIKGFKAHHLTQDTDGTWFIRKPRQKTGEESIIPLLPIALNVLQKYSPTKNIRDFNWYVSSNQKMNQGLKAIGSRAGISKILHMHLARHTFATTVTLANGVPIESVSKMLGHSNIRQTQHYAKVVALKIKNDMAKLKDLYK